MNAHKLIPGSTTSCYAREVPVSKDVEHKIDVAIFRHSSRGRKRESFSWHKQTVPVVLVRPTMANDSDAFDVTAPDYPGDEIDDIQGHSFKRISATVELFFGDQHRVAVFMLFVIGRKFRFICWDRAGVIVTPAIDYFENYAILLDLLSRISHLDDAALGFDPSATRIPTGTAEFLQMDSAARKNDDDVNHAERDLEAGEIEGPFVFEYARTLFRKSLDGDWPRHRLHVSSDSEVGTSMRNYLVGKPAFCADGVVGRGTCGYVTLDCLTGRFVWLKDVWRMSYLTADREWDILSRVNLTGIDGVPTLACHGDVLEQATISSDWSDTPSLLISSAFCNNFTFDAAANRGPLRRPTHYRIVVEEVFLPLDCFANGKQLVSLVLDTLRSRSQTYRPWP